MNSCIEMARELPKRLRGEVTMTSLGDGVWRKQVDLKKAIEVAFSFSAQR